jgi:hypothetical protein
MNNWKENLKILKIWKIIHDMKKEHNKDVEEPRGGKTKQNCRN